MNPSKVKLTFVKKNGELGTMLDNSRKTNIENILDLYDSLYFNDRESSESSYIIQDYLVSERQGEEPVVLYKFIKFTTYNDANKEMAFAMYKMIEELIVDLSL